MTRSPRSRLRRAALVTTILTLAGVAPAQDQLSPWRLCGPFDAGRRDGLATPFVDEREPDVERFTATDAAIRDGEPFHFRFPNADRSVVYLLRTLTRADAGRLRFGLGFDDSAAMWVNGVEVFRRDAFQAVVRDQHLIDVDVKAGANTILLKVVNKGTNFGFCFRVVGAPPLGHRLGAIDDGSERSPYRVTTVPLPDYLVAEIGGLAFARDGSLWFCTRRGSVYRVATPSAATTEGLGLTEFASGLHEPLGLLLDDDGSVIVAQKPELTRLLDADRDGVADTFRTVVADWGMSGNYHEYVFGPVRDASGSLWGTLNIGFPSGKGDQLRHRGSAFRVAPDGTFTIECYGLRSPNGLVVDDAGNVFYTDNQGEWMDACRLAHLQSKRFYGHTLAKQWADAMTDFGWERERTLPAVWYPYHLMKSTSWPTFDRTGGRFGPYAGQMFVGDQNHASLVRTTLQNVGDVWQGACYPFWRGFACGVNRVAFAPDGSLYLGLTERGWGSVGPKSFGLQRLTFRGGDVFDLAEVTATRDGFVLAFTAPIATPVTPDAAAFAIREYGYRYTSDYGSEEVDERTITIERVSLDATRTRVTLVTSERRLDRVFAIELRTKFTDAKGRPPIAHEAFYTLRRIPD
jgi:hypothetical protein